MENAPEYSKGDILKVVQIIDTDGAFIPASLFKQSESGKTEYFESYSQPRIRIG